MDLARRDMVAFGGAAPLHAARLGEKLGVRRIIVPAEAGVGSAVGFLLAPVAYEVVRSRHQALSALQPAVINNLMEEMHGESLSVVRQGTARNDLLEVRHAYMRYVGQGHEIPVSLPVETYGDQHADIFRASFEAVYRQLYGRIIDGVDIEVLSWTLTISAPVEDAAGIKVAPNDRRPAPAAHQSQLLFDPSCEKQVSAPVYLRDKLQTGDAIEGPALITENQTTTVVTSNYDALIDASGNIVMTRRGERS